MSDRAHRNTHVCLDFDDPQDMTTKFDALAAGGAITTPLQDTLWGPNFGTLTDAFGGLDLREWLSDELANHGVAKGLADARLKCHESRSRTRASQAVTAVANRGRDSAVCRQWRART